jgi:hypothetical protein
MPEPGYNEGESPPIWVWILGIAILIVLIAVYQSCA